MPASRHPPVSCAAWFVTRVRQAEEAGREGRQRQAGKGARPQRGALPPPNDGAERGSGCSARTQIPPCKPNPAGRIARVRSLSPSGACQQSSQLGELLTTLGAHFPVLPQRVDKSAQRILPPTLFFFLFFFFFFLWFFGLFVCWAFFSVFLTQALSSANSRPAISGEFGWSTPAPRCGLQSSRINMHREDMRVSICTHVPVFTRPHTPA